MRRLIPLRSKKIFNTMINIYNIMAISTHTMFLQRKLIEIISVDYSCATYAIIFLLPIECLPSTLCLSNILSQSKYYV